MRLKDKFLGFLFSRANFSLSEENPVPPAQGDSKEALILSDNLLLLAKHGNPLAMRTVSVLFDREYEKQCDNEFYLCAANFWAYLAARAGNKVSINKLRKYQNENSGKALKLPFDPRKGAVDIPGLSLHQLGLLPSSCNAGLFYDLLPLLKGRYFLLRAYPNEGFVYEFEDSFFEEKLLTRHFGELVGSSKTFPPTSNRYGRKISLSQLCSMLYDSHLYARENNHVYSRNFIVR